MSVQKFTPFIENESIPYAQIRQEVIDNIENLEAGFVWVYLISKPKSWIVIKEHLQAKFGIGQDKLKKIFAYLKKCNLIEYIRDKDEKGVYLKTNIRILNGSKFKSYPQNTSTGVKTTRVENHTSGFGSLVINNKHKEITKQRARTKKRAPLSLNFIPDEKRQALAEDIAHKVGIAPKDLIKKFINVQSSTNKLSCDWNAELENFLLNERIPKFKTKKDIPEPRCTVPQVDYQKMNSVHVGSRELAMKKISEIKTTLSKKLNSTGKPLH